MAIQASQSEPAGTTAAGNLGRRHGVSNESGRKEENKNPKSDAKYSETEK